MSRLNTLTDLPAQERIYHPLANLFPYMTGAEFNELVDDIKKHGLREPILLYEDMILDGRNRYRACKAAKVEPTWAAPFRGTHDEAVALVVSANIRRRHLTSKQKRELIVNLLKPTASLEARRANSVRRFAGSTIRDRTSGTSTPTSGRRVR